MNFLPIACLLSLNSSTVPQGSREGKRQSSVQIPLKRHVQIRNNSTDLSTFNLIPAGNNNFSNKGDLEKTLYTIQIIPRKQLAR